MGSPHRARRVPDREVTMGPVFGESDDGEDRVVSPRLAQGMVDGDVLSAVAALAVLGA